MNEKTGKRWHDMGGQDAGQVPREGHDFALWEKRVDALMVLCSSKGYFTVDGLRRVLEDMGEESFETMTYYERWIFSITQALQYNGFLTTEELSLKMEEVQSRYETETA